MRTTLTIDDDVACLVQEEMQRVGASYKKTVNSLLLEGVLARRKPKNRSRFVVTSIAMNLGLGTRYEKVADLIEAMEGTEHR